MPVFQHIDRFQALLHTFPDFLCGHSHVFRAESHILFHNRPDDLVVRILEYHSRALAHIPEIFFLPGIQAVCPESPFAGSQKGIDMLGECRLAGTVMSQDRHKIALLHLKAHAVHCPDRLLLPALFIVFSIIIYQLIRLNHFLSFFHPCLFTSHFPTGTAFAPDFLLLFLLIISFFILNFPFGRPVLRNMSAYFILSAGLLQEKTCPRARFG